MPSDNVSLPLADAQMLLAWMEETFGNDSGTDWHDEGAAAVGDALDAAIENFKAMRAAMPCGVSAPEQAQPHDWRERLGYWQCKRCGIVSHSGQENACTGGVAPCDGGQP